MKKFLFFMLITSLALFSSFRLKDGLEIGDALPSLSLQLKATDGSNINLQDAKKENGLLVMFSCNTCPFVIKNQERTLAICTYALKNNIGVVVLNSNEALRGKEDSYAAMKEYAKAQQYNWYYAVDENSTVADAFGANRTPECFLFDKELKLAYHGAIDDNAGDAAAVTRKHLEIAINELSAQKEISIKTSRSVGCTIKRKS